MDNFYSINWHQYCASGYQPNKLGLELKGIIHSQISTIGGVG